MIFTLRQLQEKCCEQHQPLYLAFIDLSKTFDRVSRELLWDILAQYGCPDKFIRILKLLHDNMHARVQTDGGSSEPFKVTSGVKQGCIIAPTLFTIFIVTVLHIIQDDFHLASRSRTEWTASFSTSLASKVRQRQ
ncbi:secreted RxLR effector protein 78-like [Octopus sinensis]|uniref:Secreted RxLR effector protein 78-like n=1 Tax=Octopus sinensis TaxID=2607531 RepID=A0A6P7SYF0_9MOLL|nr:secreted RxLR effector protein 78-like [Octopus sinensis]